MLGRDSATNYSVSVSLAYALGILLSYILNHRFTFGQGVPISTRTTVLFVSIALLGMAVTAILSLAIRYGTPVRTLTGSYSGTVAFGTAAVITSLLTYPLNALLVFRARNQS